MPGSTISSSAKVSRQEMIKQSVQVLSAGGTVYIGENHTESHARSVCCDILKKRCVQFLGLEFNTAEAAYLTPELIDMAERVIGHNPSFKMSKVMNACTAANGTCMFYDKQVGSTMSTRQNHIAKQVKGYNTSITQPGRGVLILIGSDHLKSINERAGQWQALQELVYSGLSFDDGFYESSQLVWQLP